MIIQYSSNNSGGEWWLKDEDWYKLEKAGWVIDWQKNHKPFQGKTDIRFLGALATNAYIILYEFKEGQAEQALEWARELWEMAIKKSSESEGCPCCGRPHEFYLINNEDRFDYVEPVRNIPFPKPPTDDEYCHYVRLATSFNDVFYSTPFPFLKK